METRRVRTDKAAWDDADIYRMDVSRILRDAIRRERIRLDTREQLKRGIAYPVVNI